MKYNYVYKKGSYESKLREVLKYYVGYIETKGKDLFIEGEAVDYPNKAIILGGKSFADMADHNMIVYRIDKTNGTVHEI